MIRSAGAPGFPLAFTTWQSSVWAKTAADRASLFEQALAVSRPVSSIPTARATPAPAAPIVRSSPVVIPRQAAVSDRILTARTPESTVPAPVVAPRSPAVTSPRPSERVLLPEPEAASKPPLAMLADEFARFGFDPATLQLTESRETVYYPGGSYENHLITATYSNGLKESVSVPLMMRNPKVSVADLLRPLGLYI